jgi:hypothetical protein
MVLIHKQCNMRDGAFSTLQRAVDREIMNLLYDNCLSSIIIYFIGGYLLWKSIIKL